LGGAITLGYAVAGLFFLRFWVRTHDRLFAAFALSFWVLMFERVLLVSTPPEAEFFPYIYAVRLVAYSLIIAAIIDKNRSAPSRPD